MTKNCPDHLMSIGVDIGKDTFHIVGFDDASTLVLRKMIKRLALTQRSTNCRVVLLAWRLV